MWERSHPYLTPPFPPLFPLGQGKREGEEGEGEGSEREGLSFTLNIYSSACS